MLIERPAVDLDLTQWINRSPAESDVDELVRTPFQLWDGGTLRLAYVTLADAAEWAPSLDAIAAAVRTIRFAESTRSEGLPTVSRIFGYRPRVPIRQDWCSATALAVDHPTEHATLVAGVQIVAAHYAQLNPALYQRHLALSQSRVEQEWRLEDGAFTSGIVNRNNPLKYHFDRGNFAGVWSGMLAFKHQIAGGYLAIPAYNLAIEIADRSLLLFDGQAILHGVTPIRRLSEDAQRHTLVYYSLKAMWSCAPLSQELARIKTLRTAYEARRAREPAGG